MTKHAFLCLAIPLLAAGVPVAHALDIEKDRIALRGFGTVGISCFSSNTTFYTRDEHPDGPGFDEDCDARLDSLLGLQLDANLSASLEATLQATSYYRADGSYTPELTLANLRWLPRENLAVRVGRMQSPMFLASEYRNIHYLQPWVRPPAEVYQIVTTYLHDGIELTRYIQAGDWNFSLRGGLAHSKYDVPAGYQKSTDAAKADFGYLGVDLQQGNWLVKAGYLLGRASYSNQDIDGVLGGLRDASQAFPELTTLACDLALDDKRVDIFGVGARYEDDRWLLQAEYGYRRIDSFYRDTHGAYLMAGRNLGSWMPYAILARRWSRDAGIDNIVPSALSPLNAYVDALLASTNADRTSLALGVSRKLGDRAVLKLQVDWIDPDSDSVAPFGIPAPGYAAAERETERLITLNLDFVF